MEFESFDQFVLTLSSVELDELKEILELVEDIKKSEVFQRTFYYFLIRILLSKTLRRPFQQWISILF